MAAAIDMKLEVVVIPVADIDRSRRFYGGLGWRLDADFTAPDGFRVIQFTPPGSPVGRSLPSGPQASPRWWWATQGLRAGWLLGVTLWSYDHRRMTIPADRY